MFKLSNLGVGVLLAGACFGCASAPDVPPLPASNATAISIVEGALAAHGGAEPITQSGMTIVLSGTFDLTTRLQGRNPDHAEPTPITERITLFPGGDELYYDIDWFNYYASNQQLGEYYDRDGRVLFLDHRAQNGGYLPRETVPDAKQRYTRIMPNLLLADALNQSQTLAYGGDSRRGGEAVSLLTYTTAAGDALTLEINQRTRLLSSASAVLDVPPLGETQITWRWSEFRDVGAVKAPGRLAVTLGGRAMKSSAMEVSLGVDAATFEAPGDYDLAPKPERLSPLADFVPYGAREPDVETPEPGVYLLKNLRPGFQMLFVEFEDFVLAIDAPSGWYEMQQVPPMNWSHGDTSTALGEKYVRAIEQAVPDKPIKYLVLTHHHNDHIGGMAPFLKHGADVLAGIGAAQMARQVSDASGADPAATITTITSEHTLEDETMAVRLIALPDGNPKADGYLMVYLPRQKILYTTAFIYPVPEAAFPPAESLELSLYFVEWLDASGLEVDTIYNVHAGGRVEDWQLDHLRAIARQRAAAQ